MSLGTLCLGLYLLLIGLVQVFSVSISATLLGVLALIAGALILIDSVHPISIGRRTA